MAIVEIASYLEEEINRKFKKQSVDIFGLMYSLEENPKKGKFIAQVSNVAIKELKYEGFRFYFITDNHRIRFYNADDLKDLFIKFIRMSDKKNQQKTINEIKDVLRKFGQKGF